MSGKITGGLQDALDSLVRQSADILVTVTDIGKTVKGQEERMERLEKENERLHQGMAVHTKRLGELEEKIKGLTDLETVYKALEKHQDKTKDSPESSGKAIPMLVDHAGRLDALEIGQKVEENTTHTTLRRLEALEWTVKRLYPKGKEKNDD